MNYVLIFRLTLVIDMKISYPTQGGVKLFNEVPRKDEKYEVIQNSIQILFGSRSFHVVKDMI